MNKYFTQTISRSLALASLFSGLCFSSSISCRAAVVDNSAAVTQSMKRLQQKIKRHEVDRIEITHLSYMVETLVGLKPGDVEGGYTAKYVIHDGLTGQVASKWVSILSATKFTKPDYMGGDFRWACIFYDEKGKPISSIYFDGSGERAQIDGKIVGVKGKLFPWLHATFSPIMD